MFDRHGDKIGKIDSIYLDQHSGRAEWALVNTGLFGMRSTWVPIVEAVGEPNGVRVPVEKAAVRDAPNMDPQSDMSRDQEAELFRYYGLAYDDEVEQHGRPHHGETREHELHDDPGQRRQDARRGGPGGAPPSASGDSRGAAPASRSRKRCRPGRSSTGVA